MKGAIFENRWKEYCINERGGYQDGYHRGACPQVLNAVRCCPSLAGVLGQLVYWDWKSNERVCDVTGV